MPKRDMSDSEFVEALKSKGFKESSPDEYDLVHGTRTFSLKLNEKPKRKRRALSSLPTEKVKG